MHAPKDVRANGVTQQFGGLNLQCADYSSGPVQASLFRQATHTLKKNARPFPDICRKSQDWPSLTKDPTDVDPVLECDAVLLDQPFL